MTTMMTSTSTLQPHEFLSHIQGLLSLILDGLEVVDAESAVSAVKFDISQLRPASFLKDSDGGWISGEEMCARAKMLSESNGAPLLGLADGLRLLFEQDKIAVEFQDFGIPLTRTPVRRRGEGRLGIVCLIYSDSGRWVPILDWLDTEWTDMDCLPSYRTV